MDEKIIEESEKLISEQKKIIQELLEKGFSRKEIEYNLGYIKGVQSMMNICFNATTKSFPIF